MGQIDLTPSFVYTEPVETVKRFIEELSLANNEPNDSLRRELVAEVLLGLKGTSIGDVRVAMKEVLTQDIELQIANKTFPLPRRNGA